MGAKVFFVWGGCCFICIFFVWAMIYETKGLSLEQVDELYGKVSKAWRSPGFPMRVRASAISPWASSTACTSGTARSSAAPTPC